MNARSKMISFRLSAEEYEHFRELCLKQGIRSISEMARTAVNKLAQDPNAASATIEFLESRVRSLEGQVQVLAFELRRFQHSVGNTAKEPSNSAASSGRP
ncbi:MAG TPA: hypothetical protein VEU96_02075 [Bryobacteraceae bacterium]|nr:hypothetical protein [Bryobacteraceae bacterium]